ncbi:hypothetical protein ABIC28_001933 [Rhodococcus sp. PvR044]|uniref:hypothetical protein n=1 Tax=unclassified Rhodococcus (in: high G+C Gram-positive bacteria) TaxID=192944 RepID=UPI000BD22FD5|nr:MULTISPECIES: hypothetical protein [unclassified Rhodococcus (in: high G+C Gram-positive bacteria)]MBP1161045.1 hypothetical protein [Rhodococcus sp. PvR099]PTR39439.1 hypothetical protein C8K38_11530 [Rhodococcus sp. OK611]SNX92590.1 hypothetical protein SAMN05447004_11530 [Rhodococcus sp. OK270]
MTPTDDAKPLDADERAELLRLRAQVAATERARAAGPEVAKRHGIGGALRWTASGLLIVLVAVLLLTSLLARFTRSEILDTDRYVATVAPLGSDPAIQDEITDQVTRQIFTRLDVEKITQEALTALTENAPRVPPQVVGLAPVIAGQAEGFIRDTVHSLVTSDKFESAWIDANRIAHESLVAVATGETGVVEIDEKGTVSVPLNAILGTVKENLTERGFAFADKIPETDASFVIFQSADLVKAQKAVNALDKAATWLPWLGVLAAIGAVFAAPHGRRLRALSLVGLGVAIAMALLSVSLHIARAVYIDDIPSDVLSPAAAAAVVDAIAAPLKTMLRAWFLTGIVVALIGYLTGGSHSALAVRRGFTRGVDKIRKTGEGRAPTQFEVWTARLRVPLRVAIVAIAVAVLVFWTYPSGVVVFTIALLALLALIAVEVLARPGVAAAQAEAEVPSPEVEGASAEADSQT